MSEAVSGLALAASILQVLDYGRQFVTTAWKLYESRVDAVKSIAVLQRLSKNLDSTLQSAKQTPSTLGSGIDQEINARRSKRKAFRAASVTLWNRDEIRSLDMERDEINRRLTLALIASLRY